MDKAQPRDEFLRRRAERQRKIRKRRLITAFIVLIILTLCTLAVLSVTVFFPIEKIIASGSSYYTAEALEKASGVKIGDNLIITSRSKIEKNLKEKLPYVEKVSLKKELPGKLEIIAEDAEEFACYLVNDRYYIVSESGWVLAEAGTLPEKLLAVIGADVKCKTGTEAVFKDSEQNELINRIIDICNAHNISLSALDISNPVALNITLENRISVQIGTANSLEEKLKHLGGMLKEISAEKTGKIDLSMWSETNPQETFTAGVTE